MPDHALDFLIDEYMVYCHSRQLRKKTMESYEQSLCLFERWCREKMQITTAELVTESVLRRYITDLQERGKYTFYAREDTKALNCPERRRDFRAPVSATTINNYLRNLRAFFNWLEADSLLRKNPTKRVKQLKASRSPREYIDDGDFKRLVGSLDKSYFPEHRDMCMIVLMLDSGMRLGECCCLTTADIDPVKKQIHLSADITKGRTARTVFYSAKTENILRRWLQYKDRYVESAYLYPIRNTGAHVTVNNFESNFKAYLRRAGLSTSITPHCLRNNFAKRCLMNGMDIYTLSRILGHSSVQVTEKAYLDLTEEDIGKRYQRFSPLSNL